MSKNGSILSGKKGLDNNLFDKLGQLSKENGTPDIASMEALAEAFLIGKAQVYGTASFYDFTRPENAGKKAYVCNGSACLTAGTQDLVRSKLESHFEEHEIGEMCCLGRCHEAAAYHVDGCNHSGKDIDTQQPLTGNPILPHDIYHVKAHGNSVLTSPITDINSYYAVYEKAIEHGADWLLDEIKRSGVRGRGGAGFPMAIKLESCRNTASNMRFIVCNADEGDPGAYSDRYLLEQQPYAVLLGMQLAGLAASAEMGVIYIRAEYPEAIHIMEKAIDELRKQGWIGKNIRQREVQFDFKIVHAQGAYICGEETALLNSIEGQRPEVRTRPPFPAQQGLFNKPTVVNNVETLACLPYIVSNGGEAFAKIGIGRSTGTKLVSLDSHFNRPGIYEVDMGTPLKTVIHELGMGFTKPIKALHIGGPLGGLVPIQHIESLSIDFESFSKEGFLLGHASIVCIPADFPIVRYIQHLFHFTAHESCGKCFPCRLGSTRGSELLDRAIERGERMDESLFRDLLETMEVGSLCALGGGLPLPVKNALKHFPEETKSLFTSN